MHSSFDVLSIIYQTMHRQLVIVCKIDYLQAHNVCFNYFLSSQM